MLRVLAGVLAFATALGSAALAASVFAQSSLTPVWTLTTGFASPESAFYDAASNAVFVSSINGQILEKDGNGYISRLSPEGTVVAEKWATGLSGPKGLRSARGVLYAADIDTVVGFELHREAETRGRAVPRLEQRGRVRFEIEANLEGFAWSSRTFPRSASTYVKVYSSR